MSTIFPPISDTERLRVLSGRLTSVSSAIRTLSDGIQHNQEVSSEPGAVKDISTWLETLDDVRHTLMRIRDGSFRSVRASDGGGGVAR